MDLREVGWGGMDWIDLDQNRSRWKSPMNMVFKKIWGNFLVTVQLAASERLSPIELVIYDCT
jgi:hypothetical protein